MPVCSEYLLDIKSHLCFLIVILSVLTWGALTLGFLSLGASTWGYRGTTRQRSPQSTQTNMSSEHVGTSRHAMTMAVFLGVLTVDLGNGERDGLQQRRLVHLSQKWLRKLDGLVACLLACLLDCLLA